MVRAAGTPPTLDELNELPEPSWRLLLGRGLPQFVGEATLPVLVFYAAWRTWGLGPALVFSTVVSLVFALWLLRTGRDAGVVVVGVVFVVIQAVVALAAHSAIVYLAQPVVLSVLWAFAYAGSVVVRRPLIGVFASAWYPFPAWFRESQPFQSEFGMQSLVWAAFCLVRAGLRLFALLHSGVGAFVVVSLVTGTPALVALVGWGLWHARRSFGRLVVAEPAA